MTCKCICNCKQEADDADLCAACGLCAKLDTSAIPKHGLPYVPTVWPELEPEVPISKEQKDRAIKNAVDELI